MPPVVSNISILGMAVQELRGKPLERKFTRPSHQIAYDEAVQRLKEDSAASIQLQEEATKETNSDSMSALAAGSMKFVAAADSALVDYLGKARRLDGNDVDRIFNASRLYHFAGNTLRRLHQFDVSADFFLLSAQLGHSLLVHNINSSDGLDEPRRRVLAFSMRSYTRARVAYREAGSDESSESAYIQMNDFALLWAKRDGSIGHYLRLGAWNLFSRYGTSFLRLLATFIVFIFIATSFHASLSDKSLEIRSFLRSYLDSVLLALNFTPQGRMAETQSDLAYLLDGIVGISGFFWLALIAQVLIHRTASKR